MMRCNKCGKEEEELSVYGFCDECRNKERKSKYSFLIRTNSHGNYASIYYSKNYGNSMGGAEGVESKEDVIKRFKEIKRGWEEYDGIVRRKGDKVTPDNLFFYSCKEEISKMDLFGIRKLTDF